MKFRFLISCPVLALAATAAITGCSWNKPSHFSANLDGCYESVAADIEYPTTSDCTVCEADPMVGSLKPITLSDDVQPEYWDISLQEVIHLAMSNSRVLTELGGAVLRAPEAIRTQYDPAITETDPRFGVEAALSAFDAQLTTNAFFDKNDRELNNIFFGGGIRQLQQDLMNWDTEISKLSATGSEFAIRHHVDYDANNAPGNAFPSAFNAWVEGEIRHPLLQGSGSVFNRIAGPSRVPGFYNGVLLARINTDVQLTEFEIAVRDFVSNLENAYWDLYFAYRDLDAKIAARDEALNTWRKVYALYKSERRGGEAANEAQAREQFYRFQEEVQNALSGQLLDGTRTNNGSPGGTFRASGGVHVTERRLRLLMGLPPGDGRLLRPADEPIACEMEFDWDQVTHDVTTRRAELRRQLWKIRRRELELIASKNFLLPRVDAVGQYRWRGFGHKLFGTSDVPPPPLGIDPLTGASAYDQLVSGNFQEWQLGVELSMPIGFRQAHAGVRNAQLMLARERAILNDQQLELLHQSADSVAEVDRTLVVSQTGYSRLIAAQTQLDALLSVDEGEEAPLIVLLDAQKRRAEAESQYYRALAEYAVAVKNVHYNKGTLLEYCGIYMAEGSWPAAAHLDAAELERRRGKPRPLNYASAHAPIVSRGSYAQMQAPCGCPKVPMGEVTNGGEAIGPGTPAPEPPLDTQPQTERLQPAQDDFGAAGWPEPTEPIVFVKPPWEVEPVRHQALPPVGTAESIAAEWGAAKTQAETPTPHESTNAPLRPEQARKPGLVRPVSAESSEIGPIRFSE